MTNELREMLENIREELTSLYEAEYTEEEREELEELEERGDNADLWDYFRDVLDVEYRVSSRGEYRGAYIWVTLGGPNIYIDTFAGVIRGAWGSDRDEVWLPSEICAEIDAIFEEYFACCIS